MDREQIISILNEWNFWNRDLPGTVKRQYYEDKILKSLKAKEITVIKGVRRSGKSTLLINTIKNLINSGISKKNILFINLEEPRFSNELNLSLLDKIKEAYHYYLSPDSTPYIFLDEVQNVSQFEKWLLKEYELKNSFLFISGSNSKLLSKEIGSSLSGRYIDIEIKPLNFKEFLLFKNYEVSSKLDFLNNKLQIEKMFEEFINFGGFPKVVLTDDVEIKREELRVYFDSILLRDIVARYNLDNFRALEKIAIFLFSNISNLISLNSIKKSMNLSYDLISRYFEYLENAYMIFRIPLFSWSLKKQQANLKKVYAIDTGLAKNTSFEIGKKLGDYIENVVFLELLKNNREIYYYKTAQNYEVDFVVKEGNQIKYLIQVSISLKDKKVRNREIRALIKAKEEIKHSENAELIIITFDSSKEEIVNGQNIKIINIFEWLLDLV